MLGRRPRHLGKATPSQRRNCPLGNQGPAGPGARWPPAAPALTGGGSGQGSGPRSAAAGLKHPLSDRKDCRSWCEHSCVIFFTRNSQDLGTRSFHPTAVTAPAAARPLSGLTAARPVLAHRNQARFDYIKAGFGQKSFEILTNSRNLCTIDCPFQHKQAWAGPAERSPPSPTGTQTVDADRGRRLLALLEIAPSCKRLGVCHALKFYF